MSSKKRGMGYEAIADVLRTRIISGELPPGEKVPSENALMEDYGVGRDTAYKALQVLRDEGLTTSRRGAPTRVRRFHPIRRPASRRLSADTWGSGTSMWDVDVRDDRPDVRDVEITEPEATTRIASALAIKRGQPVVRRSRRYFLDGKAVQQSISHLPGDIAAGTRIAEVDTGPGGIYARLAELGHEPAEFKEEVRFRRPTKEERVTLELERGDSVIHIVRTARTKAGRIVEVNDMRLDSSMYILEYDISS